MSEGAASIAAALEPLDDLVVCGHVSPDGDCLGSALALAFALRAQGKRVTCLLAHDDPVEPGLRFLPGFDGLVPAASYDGALGAFVSVDAPTRARLGDAACALHDAAPRTVSIDHHPAIEGDLSQVNWVEPDAPACAMLVWKVLGCMDVRVTPEMALCCYTGLCTDTGGFRYQNATADAFAAAAQMVAAGADAALVAREVFQNRTPQSLALEQVMLQNMRLLCNGKLSLSWVTAADFERLGAVKADAEPLIDELRSVGGIEVACMLRDQNDGVRGSLRAKDRLDVSGIARGLGGGGHAAAAGFTFDGGLEEAIHAVEQAVAALL